jgi:hypothetical protein
MQSWAEESSFAKQKLLPPAKGQMITPRSTTSHVECENDVCCQEFLEANW